MHFPRQGFSIQADLPDGTSRILLFVPRYNFGWQLTYFFKEPVAALREADSRPLPITTTQRGTKFNPDPTKFVTWVLKPGKK